MNIEIFELSRNEKDSALWKKLSSHISKRLQEMRSQNDVSISIEETERLRGRIAFAKELLDLSQGNVTDRKAGNSK